MNNKTLFRLKKLYKESESERLRYCAKASNKKNSLEDRRYYEGMGDGYYAVNEKIDRLINKEDKKTPLKKWFEFSKGDKK